MTMLASRKFKAKVQIGKLKPDSPMQTVDALPDGLRMAIEMNSPVMPFLRGFVIENSKHRPRRVIHPDVHKGKVLALCGAGPSLHVNPIQGADIIWACNSALPWLVEKGEQLDKIVGIGIDQTKGLLKEWATAPAVPYLLASSVDPELVRFLADKGRDLRFFHNAVGLENEFDLYCSTFPPTFMVGRGATVVSRMVSVAFWMGFERIDIYGADSAFGPGDVTHANGTVATEAYNNPLLMTGEVDGRTYRTRPDMLMGAVDLADYARTSEGRVRLIGDTLPVALQTKPQEYLDLVMRRLVPGEIPPAPSFASTETE